ncbi:MAG: PAS domain S-box protein [Bacteroidota bacterium]
MHIPTNSIIHLLSTPIIITDGEYRFVEINQAARQIFSESEPTLQKTLMHYLDCTKEDLNNLISNKVKGIENIHRLNVGNHLIHQSWTLKGSSCTINENEDGFCFVLEESPDARYKSIEQELHFYKDLLDNLPADVGVFNEEQKYLYINPHAIKDPELRKWMIGKDDFDYCRARNIPTTFAEDRRDKFNSFLKNKSTFYTFEETSERNNIASHNLRIVYGFYNPDGSFKYALGYGINIDQLKNYELINFRQQTAIEISNDGIALLNSHDEYTYVNKALVQMLGLNSENDMIGRKWRDFFPDSEVNHLADEVYPILLEKKFWRGEAHGYKYNSNQQLIVELTINLMPDKGLVCICRDVTERKQQEEQINRLALVASNTNNMVIITDAQSQIEWVNEAFTITTGYTLEEVKGKEPRKIFNGPETDAAIVEKLRETELNHQSFSGEKLSYKKDGSTMWVYLMANPIFNEQGKITNWVSVETDITPIKNAELVYQNALIKEKTLSDLKSQFVSLASHEFRTPLAGIMTSIEIVKVILDKEKAIYPERIDVHLERCIEEIQRLTSIMDNVLISGKMQLGKMPFEPIVRDFIPFINEVLKNFQMIFPNRIVNISNNYSSINMSFDGKLLEHAINNVLNNANKYSPEESMIEVWLEEQINHIQLTVIDYGIGIPEEEQVHLFSSFFRASNTISHHGTGLGLGIVKQFIEIHDGNVMIESKINQGCKVIITLPKNFENN